MQPDFTQFTAEPMRIVRQRLAAAFAQNYAGILDSLSPADYIRTLDDTEVPGGYGRQPHALEDWCHEVMDRAGSGAVDNYHRLVIANLLADIDRRIAAAALPESIQNQLLPLLERIQSRLESTDARYYRFDNDLFRKDLALCRLRLLPCGSELIDTHSGIPRSVVLGAGPGQALSATGLILFKGRGFSPWYESHWDRRLARQFTPAGYDQCYLRIAELLETDTAARGMFGSSWWFDPALDDISPEFGFLRKVPLQNGARLFRVGITEFATRSAIKLSTRRRQLYEAGTYVPTNYLLAWTRRDLLAWADHYRSQPVSPPSGTRSQT